MEVAGDFARNKIKQSIAEFLEVIVRDGQTDHTPRSYRNPISNPPPSMARSPSRRNDAWGRDPRGDGRRRHERSRERYVDRRDNERLGGSRREQ